MQLKKALNKKKFIVTSEVQAPLGGTENPDDIVKELNLIRGRVDGVSVVDTGGIQGIVSDSVKTCNLLQKNQFDAIYQTTTRDKNRIQLQKDLFSAYSAGVENLLVFTEDYRITGESLQENMFFHVDSGKLSSILQHLKEGNTFDGKTLKETIDFTMGAGVESLWGRKVPKQGMYEMETMKSIGTSYFLTTPVFNLEQFYKFNEQIKTFDIPVIAEVMIIRNASVARFINRHFKFGLVPEWAIQKLESSPIKKKASIELFADTVAGLKEICKGVHIITFGNITDIKSYFTAAKLT